MRRRSLSHLCTLESPPRLSLALGDVALSVRRRKVRISRLSIVHASLTPTYRWAAFPFAAVVAFQGYVPWARRTWSYFVLAWMVGGGWWNLVGALVVTFIHLISHLPLWMNYLLLTFLKFSATFFSAWWIRLPLVLVILAAWVLLILLAAASAAAHGGGKGNRTVDNDTPLLSTLVPPDARGEVARVLGCQNYYAVLEVPVTADGAEVKKSFRKKMLLVHPDKNGGAAHSNEARMKGCPVRGLKA